MAVPGVGGCPATVLRVGIPKAGSAFQSSFSMHKHLALTYSKQGEQKSQRANL